jgi:hypothetical protein
MSTLRRLPVLYVALGLAAVASAALSVLVLSGAFELRTTITGAIFFDACNGAMPDASCPPLSHWAADVAIEYQALGLLPLSYTTHTNGKGEFKLEVPPGHYRLKIKGCKSWTGPSTSPPDVVVPGELVDSGSLWVISANGTCQTGGIAL